jgi:hypothetical protein
MDKKYTLVGVLTLFIAGYLVILGYQKIQEKYPNLPQISKVQTKNNQNKAEKEVVLNNYKNSKFGYSFSYPTDWKVTGSESDSSIGLAPKNSETPMFTIEVSGMMFGEKGEQKFEDYVLEAARNEIQNYKKLSAVNEVMCATGKGYETTWIVNGMRGGSYVSNPITYFPIGKKYGMGMMAKRLAIYSEDGSDKYKDVYKGFIESLSLEK